MKVSDLWVLVQWCWYWIVYGWDWLWSQTSFTHLLGSLALAGFVVMMMNNGVKSH